MLTSSPRSADRNILDSTQSSSDSGWKERFEFPLDDDVTAQRRSAEAAAITTIGPRKDTAEKQIEVTIKLKL